MNFFLRDRLIALGFTEEQALKHMRMVEMWEQSSDGERALLVIKGEGQQSFITSMDTPSIEGETPCLIFEIGDEEES